MGTRVLLVVAQPSIMQLTNTSKTLRLTTAAPFKCDLTELVNVSYVFYCKSILRNSRVLSIRPTVSSLPSSSRESPIGGLTVDPVIATRIG